MIFLREPFLNQADDILTSSSDYRSTFISCSISYEEEEYLLFFLLSIIFIVVSSLGIHSTLYKNWVLNMSRDTKKDIELEE